MKKKFGIGEIFRTSILVTLDTLRTISQAFIKWRKEWRIERFNRNRYKMQCERYNYEK